MLNPLQRQRLLQIARNAIATALEGRRPEDARFEDPALQQPSGAFVTLRAADGDLRGCIGSILPEAPLHQAVADNAVNAAFRDPRFPPLDAAELREITLEISVMGAIVPVSNPEEIEPGRDGLIIRRGKRAGLLLPQVAAEYGWNRYEFLDHTCVKAGLSPGSWREPDSRIERFSAEVFSEATPA